MEVDQQPLSRLAIAAGLLGLLSFALLVGALAAPTPDPHTLRRYGDLFRWQDAAVIAQALVMIPLTIGLGRRMTDRGVGAGVSLGALAQAVLALSSALIFLHVTSDTFYMAPFGLVGVWLILLNRRLSALDPWRSRLGVVAGAGLVILGLSFLAYALLVAPAVLVRPLSNAEIDAQSWTAGNVIAHVGLAVGTLLGRTLYPVWLLWLGLDWSRKPRAVT